MITLVHCNVTNSAGPAINGLPRCSDTIFKDCWRSIDNRDEIQPSMKDTTQQFNRVSLNQDVAVQFNVFIGCDSAAIKVGFHRNTDETHFKRNTYIDMPTAVDRSDDRYQFYAAGYPLAVDITTVTDSVFDGVENAITQNYALVSENHNLLNGAINGSVTQGANSIGPGLSARFLDSEADNYRLERAGVLGVDFLRAEFNSPGALANSVGTDMGAYHRADSAASLFSKAIYLDSPPIPNWELKAINSETVDGLGFVKGGTTGSANSYALDYHADLGHTRQAAAHAFRAIRRAYNRPDAAVVWSRLGEMRLPVPDENARIIRDISSQYSLWTALWRNDPVYGNDHATGFTITAHDLQLNIDAQPETRYKTTGIVFDPARFPADMNYDWLEGLLFVTWRVDQATRFSTYNATGNTTPAGAPGAQHPYIYKVVKVMFDKDTKRIELLLDVIYRPNTHPIGAVFEGSFTRAEWFGTVTMAFDNRDRLIADLRGLNQIVDGYPGMFDGFNLSLSYAADLITQIAGAPAYMPINNTPWYAGDQWLFKNEPIVFRMQSVESDDTAADNRRYELEPLGVDNPFLVSATTAQKASIAASLFVGGIWNQFVVPAFETVQVSSQHETKDLWNIRGGDWLPTTTYAREATSLSMSGAKETLIQTSAPHIIWPFSRG